VRKLQRPRIVVDSDSQGLLVLKWNYENELQEQGMFVYF